jgi:hypothetical protein
MMRTVGHVVCTVWMGNAYKILDDHLGGIEVDEMILLKWILREV